MSAIEQEDNAMFCSIVRDHVNLTPFDKINNKLVVTVKTKHCPEIETKRKKAADDGYDFNGSDSEENKKGDDSGDEMPDF